MATTYVKFTSDEGREAGIKQLFGLDEKDEATQVFMEKVNEGYAGGGLTVEVVYVKNPVTPYQKLMNSLAEIGVTGIRFQKTYKGEKAAWLALRLKSMEHKEKLEKGLDGSGLDVVK
jgi:hypothetical protein